MLRVGFYGLLLSVLLRLQPDHIAQRYSDICDLLRQKIHLRPARLRGSLVLKSALAITKHSLLQYLEPL
jgi:hypothetical protein